MNRLNSAIKFHGHLGPWLVIGLILGEFGLKKIKAEKYFGLKINAVLPYCKPFSCLIDGLQLSSGCTLGKANIKVIPRRVLKIKFVNLKNKKSLVFGINDKILSKLNQLKSHSESEAFARRIYRMKPERIFKTLSEVS